MKKSIPLIILLVNMYICGRYAGIPPVIFLILAPLGLLLVWFPESLRTLFRMELGKPGTSPPPGIVELIGYMILSLPLIVMVVFVVSGYLR